MTTPAEGYTTEDAKYLDWLVSQLPKFTDEELVEEIRHDPVAAMDNYRRFAAENQSLRERVETAEKVVVDAHINHQRQYAGGEPCICVICERAALKAAQTEEG